MATNLREHKHWLDVANPSTKFVCDLFKGKGYEVRIVGGAVRDVLQDKPPKDIDIATNATPEQMVELCKEAEVKHILTGIQHGTLTLMVNDIPFEVTTLRIDTHTDGRHAEVEFTTDFQLDAARRDLTINAMSVDIDGTLYDYFDGTKHLKNKQVLFVGDPVDRIAEDYLRILRYFRFYGRIADDDNQWDDATIAAIDKNKDGLNNISRERIWLEMQKIIVGNHATSILLKMKSLHLYPLINISENNFSVDHLDAQHKISHIEQIRPVTLLSYAFKTTENFSKLRKSWKMSGDEEYIGQFVIKHRHEHELKYFQDLRVDTPKPLKHKFHMAFRELCLSRGESGDALLKRLSDWKVPECPLRGDQVKKCLKLPNGPLINKYFSLGKNKWKASHYSLSGEELLDFLHDEYSRGKV